MREQGSNWVPNQFRPFKASFSESGQITGVGGLRSIIKSYDYCDRTISGP